MRADNEMAAMNGALARLLRPSRVIFYVYFLTALIIVSVGVAVGSFAWYVAREAAISDEIVDYHHASIDAIGRIEREIAFIHLTSHEIALAEADLHDEPAAGIRETPGQGPVESLHIIENQMRQAADLQALFK